MHTATILTIIYGLWRLLIVSSRVAFKIGLNPLGEKLLLILFCQSTYFYH